ncbi:unnamed protein product, partial [Medioppia subpectinata]
EFDSINQLKIILTNSGQQSFNIKEPFVFDLPPLQLQPLQLRLNPSSSSLFLVKQNETIPIETFPSQSSPNNQFSQTQPKFQNIQIPQNVAPISPQPVQPISTPVTAQPLAPKQFQFLPLTFQPFPSQQPAPKFQAFQPLVQQSPAPQPLPQSQPKATQTLPQNAAQLVPQNVQPVVPNDSPVSNEIPNIESVLRDLSLYQYIPFQLPANAFIFQQPIQFQTNPTQTFQSPVSDKNTHVLPPVTLPAINLPPEESPINIFFSQTASNTPTVPSLPSAPVVPTTKANQEALRASIKKFITKPSIETQLFNKQSLQTINQKFTQFLIPTLAEATESPLPIDDNQSVNNENQIGFTNEPEINRIPITTDKSVSETRDTVEFGTRLNKIIPSFTSYFNRDSQ